MRSNLAIFAVCILVAAPPIARADDPAVDSNSLFKRRAEAVTKLNTLSLEQQVQAREDELKKSQAVPKDTTPKKAAPVPVRLHEIGGSAGKLIATFRLANGSLRDFVRGEIVPGFGLIKSITPTAVEDEKGHFFVADDLSE